MNTPWMLPYDFQTLTLMALLFKAEKTTFDLLWPPVTSALISAAVAYFIANKSSKGTRQRSLDERVIKFIELSIEYPHLESDSYAKNFLSFPPDDDNRMRYENYCCMVFNVLEAAHDLKNGNIKEMKSILDPEEMANRHITWWHNDYENQNGYNARFRVFIQSITEARR